MRKPFRFLFDDSDGAAIDEASLTVEDLPLGHSFPLGICIRYRERGSAAAQIRPIGRCRIRFLADDDAPGIKPDPNQVELDGSNYDSWKTVGRLLVDVDAHEIQRMESMGGVALVGPTRWWFWPVKITSTFLFRSLLTEGAIARFGDVLPGKVKYKPGNETWWKKNAIAQFLCAQYAPLIEIHESDPTLDVAVRVSMPEVAHLSGEPQQLNVCAAHYGPPHDGFDEDWDPDLTQAGQMARLNPQHPSNGAIPTRLAYQALEECMVDVNDDTIRQVRDSILVGTVPFRPLRFTRTWQPVANRSKYFPTQVVVFTDPEGNERHRQALPSHGVLWVPRATFDAFPFGTVLEVEGGMRWLSFSEDAWQKKGEMYPLSVTVPAPAEPQHIILRLPMREAMLADSTRPSGAGWTCTYFSMRRAVRAWADNRICGGRLSQEVNKSNREGKTRVRSDAVTLDLLRRAFAKPEVKVSGVTEYSVANNKPPTDIDSENGGNRLFALLKVLFPRITTQYPLPPGVVSAAEPVRYSEGEAAYWLWQNAYRDDTRSYWRLKDPKFVCNYSDTTVGRGGPGAIKLLGLGEYHCNAVPPVGAGTADKDDVVATMINGLEPGAVVKILWDWQQMDAYRELTNRGDPGPDVAISAHSAVFAGYGQDSVGEANALSLIDDHGDSPYRIHGTAPNRNIGGVALWVAVNWTE